VSCNSEEDSEAGAAGRSGGAGANRTHLARAGSGKAGDTLSSSPPAFRRQWGWTHASIIGLVNKGQPRKLDDWGALRAWGWGASRALDYFETDSSVDANTWCGRPFPLREGRSSRHGVRPADMDRLRQFFRRGRSEACTAGTGASWWRTCGAERISLDAGNFLKYSGPLHANDLPVDSHELIALCAPRPVFLSAGSLEAEMVGGRQRHFHGWSRGGSGYKLLGKKDLGTKEFRRSRRVVEATWLSPALPRTHRRPNCGVPHICRASPESAATLAVAKTRGQTDLP